MRVVIDLEATCWESRADRRQGTENETIEIGAVFTSDDYTPLGEFQTFIRPVRNPILTDFCTTLTSIKQSDVDKAPGFVEALIAMEKYCVETFKKKLDSIMFCSWGNYDRNQFERDCAYHNWMYPFGIHRNLKAEFAKVKGCKPKGLSRALDLLKIPFNGTHHRGIDDARNITTIAHTVWGPNVQDCRHPSGNVKARDGSNRR